jgi:TonB-linked SusC/RagA family outer membrane protein
MKKILLLLMSITTLNVAFAQRNLTGTVTAANGEPIVGASVIVKNNISKGAVADLDGKYTLTDVAADAKILVFSSVGYATKEIEIGASNVIDATLEEGSALSEVVVTAFGIKKDRSNLGYGVSQVTAQELTQAHTTNLTNALAAKVPGVRLSGSGGSFSSSSIIVRGFTSFTGSNQPLFVIDGVSVDNSGGGTALQTGVTNSSRAIDLNQEDIESISVLKGAAATALYGSRAANGVVLVTTKSGASKSKQAITYTANFSNQQVNRLPDYQNTYGQGTGGGFNPASVGSWGPKMDGRKVVLPVSFRGLNLVGLGDSTLLNPFPNNVADLFQIGNNQQHNLSFQGGNDKNTYRLSLGYLQENGVLAMNRLNRYNVGLNVNSQITKKLSTGVSVNYSLNKSIRSPQGNQLSNPLFRSWFTPRSWDLTGMPYQSATGANMHYDGTPVDNPRWTIANNLYNDQIDRLFGNVNLNYQLTDWLTARFKAGADYYTLGASYYDQIGANGGATAAQGAGGIREVRNISRILNSTAILEANKKVGDVDLTLILGNEVLDQYRSDMDIIGRGVTVRNFRNLAANTTTLLTNPSTLNGYWQYRLVGFFANATAAYKGWATLDVAARNDANSILPVANQSYLYYSVAGTLNPLKAFNVQSDIFSTLKLRANIGLTGSAKPDFRYSTDNYYSQANPGDGFGPNLAFPFNGLAGFTLQNTAGNPNLKPEFTQSTEGGIELGLFKDRIILNATFYKQHSTDVILAVPNSSAAGVAFVTLNAGSLTTTGKEISLTVAPFKGGKKGFNWSTTFNYTQFKSIVDELAPGVQNIFLGGFTTPNIRLVAGDEYGQIYGNDYNRDANGKMIVGANGLPTPTANVMKLGNPNPKYLLGISNNFSYKGLSLSILLDIKKGGDIYSRNIADLQRQGAVAETAAKERLDASGVPAKVYKFEDAVKADGTPNDIMITAEQYWGNAGKYVAAKGFIYQTDWFRVRELSVNYDLPASYFKNTFIGAVSIGFFGRNLFLSAPGYPHLDPEQNVLGVSNAQGLEFNALPQTKSMGINFRATF